MAPLRVRGTQSEWRGAVMERTDHILLVGEGADRLARLFGLEGHPGPTRRREEQFRRLHAGFREYWRRNWEIARSLGYETVGAVALDKDGNLAAAASTGGIWFKLPGRLGDTVLPYRLISYRNMSFRIGGRDSPSPRGSWGGVRGERVLPTS